MIIREGRALRQYSLRPSSTKDRRVATIPGVYLPSVTRIRYSTETVRENILHGYNERIYRTEKRKEYLSQRQKEYRKTDKEARRGEGREGDFRRCKARIGKQRFDLHPRHHSIPPGCSPNRGNRRNAPVRESRQTR